MSKPNCPGSSTLTDDGKACEVKLDSPLYCGLTNDSVPGWPRCYSNNGKAIQIPPKPGAASGGSSSTGTGKSKLQPSCSDILNVQYTDLLDSINNIHAFEGKLFEDLETVENGGESSMTSLEIKGRISDLSKLRNQLYTDLNNILTSTQCNLSDSRQNLADQIAMVDIVKKELDNAETAIKELETIRNNRRRMVQITDYEKQRFGSHKNIFRTIAFCGLGVLISVYLVNAGWGTIGKLGILASIAVGVILTMRSVYYNWWRSGMNWNRFNFGSYSATAAGGNGVYEHDVRAFDKLYDATSSEASYIESQAKREATKAYDAGEKVYGDARKIAGSAASHARAGWKSHATNKTQH
jgi:hypothetical protein|tara:strand:+ start:3332 stop:4390 length:1059 start_codon:yes stop_codon:yes gene_type:complete